MKSLQDLIIKTEKVDWKKLRPFQPDSIKKTTEQRMNKLKRSLLNNGFAMSFYAAEFDGGVWVLDGHHRLKALYDLEKDGYDIPTHFTCSLLNIKDKQHAKKIVLAFNSHYAEIQEDGLLDWIKDLSFDKVKSEFEFFELGFGFSDEFEIITGDLSGSGSKKIQYGGSRKIPVQIGGMLIFLSPDEYEEDIINKFYKNEYDYSKHKTEIISIIKILSEKIDK